MLGHLRGIVQGSDVNARISYGSVPIIDGVIELQEKGIAPGGTHRNLDSLSEVVIWHSDLDDNQQILLADAQTSGGLLISVAPEKKDELLQELESAGVTTRAVIGEILDKNALSNGCIEVTP